MAIHRLLENSAFGPEEIEAMVVAYEKALSAFALKSGDYPAARLVAKKIIKVAPDSRARPRADLPAYY
jgi:hypothetical protein